MSKRVYLCGPIAGTTYDESAIGWRKYVHDHLTYPFGSHEMKSEIEVFSPMRGKKALSQMGTLGKQAYDDIGSPVSTVRGIVGRDNNDIMRCDVMFAYFLDTTAVSIGSMAEFGLAYAYRKPIVTVMTPNNIHNHIFTQGMSTYITEDIDEAIYLTKMLLEPGLH